MNPMDDERDEEQIESLLSAASRDAVLPDPVFLANLREQSTQVFGLLPQSISLRKRGRVMTARAAPRPGRFTGRCCCFSAGGVYWWLFVRDANPAFAQVLENIAQAKSIHVRLVRDGKTYEVWVESTGLLRRDNPDGTYQIAADGKLVAHRREGQPGGVRQSPTTATRHPSSTCSPLLDLAVEPDRRALAAVSAHWCEPSATASNAWSTTWKCRNEEDPVDIEALVDRQTRLIAFAGSEQRKDKGEAKLFAELNVLAYNEEVPEEKFVVRDTLTEDGRIGKVTDVQGVVSRQAGAAPALDAGVAPTSLLKPGDWVRTDLRGANAAALRLVKRTRRHPRSRHARRAGQPDRDSPASRAKWKSRSRESAAWSCLARTRNASPSRARSSIRARQGHSSSRVAPGAALAARLQGHDERTNRSARWSPASMAAMCR